MKKIAVFLLTMVLVLSLGLSVVSAAPSPEAQGVVSGIAATDADEKEADVSLKVINGKVDKSFQNTLKGIKDETSDKTLKIVGHYELEVNGTPKYPISVSLNVLGISASSKAYVLVQKGSEVVSITPTVKDGKISFTLEEKVDKIAIVTDGKTATQVEKENNVKSPETADTTPYVVLIALIAVLALIVTSKKVKA